MDDAPIIYGLEDFQARALAAHSAETEKINFLVGTQSLRRTNQVQLIEFDDDTSLVTKQTFEHPAGEVWKIVAAPQSPDIIATVYNNTQDYCGEFGAAIWRLSLEGSLSGPLDDTRCGGEQVEKLCDLNGACDLDAQIPGSPVPGLGSQAWSVVWAPEKDSHLVTLVDNHVYHWDVEAAGRSARVIGKVTVEGRGTVSLGSGRWYPHQHGSQVAATHGSSVRAWDMRTMKPTWVWSVRYNASYDQLVLTCSSDQRIILSNLPSIASQPFGTMVDQEDTSKEEKDKVEGTEEGVIQIYDDHEDSVYAVEWSAADFWTFASLSYDGRLVINKVPRSVKYKQFM
ncbi:EARP-interacting [Chionoecetes opilio]|uniref:EARP-interacting n=1 Tax=Chionoecetes opilio TaxID=41210 RepID=A0A8J4XTE2_CHIOP|nr:EARP-interacting [Chionoecetes opilio]